MPRVIVIGGGISGLSAAHYLLQEVPDVDLLLVESGSRLGGTLGSEIVDDYVFERGANGFSGDTPHTLELARELGLGERLQTGSPRSRHRYILKNGRLHAVPTGTLALLRSPLLSMRGRIRALMEPLQKKQESATEESVAAFGRRRLGEEAVRALLDPLVSGIHAGDVERLSMQSAFPKLADLETRHGSVVRGLIGLKQEQARSTDGAPANGGLLGSVLYSFPGGMGELVDALGERLEAHIRLKWRATGVSREGDRFRVYGPDGAREEADGVLLGLPSYRAASLFASKHPETAHAFESIPYAPIAAVCLGFRRAEVKKPLDGYGFMIPRDQGLRLLGAICVSSVYPEHAPPDGVNLRCLIGGARDPDILNNSDDNLLELILEELRPILGLEGDPAPVRIFRYGRGLPQYNLGHRQRIERLERQLWDLPGLFVVGNAYHGIGLNDCVREGKKKARAVKEFFRR